MIMSDNSLDKLNNTANNEAKIIEKWLTSNKLTLNVSKTSFMLFSRKKMSTDKFSLTIRGERINRTSIAKYLAKVDARLEAKAKDTKKSEAKAKDRNARGQGQGPRTQTLEFSEKKALQKFFSAISKKHGLEKHFLADLQNFNHSKSMAI